MAVTYRASCSICSRINFNYANVNAISGYFSIATQLTFYAAEIQIN